MQYCNYTQALHWKEKNLTFTEKEKTWRVLCSTVTIRTHCTDFRESVKHYTADFFVFFLCSNALHESTDFWERLPGRLSHGLPGRDGGSWRENSANFSTVKSWLNFSSDGGWWKLDELWYLNLKFWHDKFTQLLQICDFSQLWILRYITY